MYLFVLFIVMLIVYVAVDEYRRDLEWQAQYRRNLDRDLS